MQSADPDNSIVPSIDADRLLIALLNEKKRYPEIRLDEIWPFPRKIGLMLDGSLCKNMYKNIL